MPLLALFDDVIGGHAILATGWDGMLRGGRLIVACSACLKVNASPCYVTASGGGGGHPAEIEPGTVQQCLIRESTELSGIEVVRLEIRPVAGNTPHQAELRSVLQ
ncbi:hypothetical protein BaRGS_00019695 [Batillaria attramentaria]|uniref:Uncharacterized protein n=1 Tax=Batillaria attramentaria TaxID=370345 RepID=A0ABD0KPK0_9CAEN